MRQLQGSGACTFVICLSAMLSGCGPRANVVSLAERAAPDAVTKVDTLMGPMELRLNSIEYRAVNDLSGAAANRTIVLKGRITTAPSYPPISIYPSLFVTRAVTTDGTDISAHWPALAEADISRRVHRFARTEAVSRHASAGMEARSRDLPAGRYDGLSELAGFIDVEVPLTTQTVELALADDGPPSVIAPGVEIVLINDEERQQSVTMIEVRSASEGDWEKRFRTLPRLLTIEFVSSDGTTRGGTLINEDAMQFTHNGYRARFKPASRTTTPGFERLRMTFITAHQQLQLEFRLRDVKF